MIIIYNKLDNYFFDFADRQTFLSFEMTANLRDTSPFNCSTFQMGISYQGTFVNLFSKNINSLGVSGMGGRGWSLVEEGWYGVH